MPPGVSRLSITAAGRTSAEDGDGYRAPTGRGPGTRPHWWDGLAGRDGASVLDSALALEGLGSAGVLWASGSRSIHGMAPVALISAASTSAMRELRTSIARATISSRAKMENRRTTLPT